MSDRDALLAAVLAEPEDDAPRLIMADWLDDHDEPELAAFIRQHIEAFREKGEARVLKHKRVRYGRWEWTHSKYDDNASCCGCPFEWASAASLPVSTRHYLESYEVCRGFVERITCPASDAISHLDSILAAQPVQEVTLTSELDWDARGNLWLCSADHRTSRECKIGIPDDHPVWGQDFSNEPLRLSPQRNAMVAALLAAEWPRIKKWNLPPQQQYGPSPLRAAFRTWQEAIDAQAYSMRHFSR